MSPYGMTREEVDTVRFNTVLLVAQKIGIKMPELYFENELKEKIKNTDKELFEKLESYTISFEKWFDFHEKLAEKSSGKLFSEDDERKMTELSEAKNTSRFNLIDYLEKKSNS